ncbi:MAG: ATP-binding protein [Bacteroidetes bacterium]|nr:MAG: ATP-binding protein [Bacteroidota bacterium]
MLIEFAVTNFRSFKERQVFSMLPASNVVERTILPLKADQYPDLHVLPTAVLYGRNNSGKSNFLKAFRALKWLVTESTNFNSNKKLNANEFFLLNNQTLKKSTIFEIDFVAPNQKRYEYFIEFNQKEILIEQLYTKNSEYNKQLMFNRQGLDVTLGTMEQLDFKFLHNQLYLSIGDNKAVKELQEVYTFFAEHLIIQQFTETEYTNYLTQAFTNFVAENEAQEMLSLIEKVLQETDTNILGIETSAIDIDKIHFPDDTPQKVKDRILDQLKYEIRTKHTMFDGTDEIGVTFMPLEFQSVGTRKLLGLTPSLISALSDGDILFIDEMNTSMHTELTTWLIDLFNNPETNPNKAQLVITTHDIALLDKQLYEKDHIYIVEKNKYGASELYSFADIDGLPNNARLSDYYESGRLGGIPHITKPYLQHVIKQFLQHEKEQQ